MSRWLSLTLASVSLAVATAATTPSDRAVADTADTVDTAGTTSTRVGPADGGHWCC